jgi:nucleotide-binding universal stress UspA family protein
MPGPESCPTIHDRMSADIILSYDGTPSDDDALALGLALAAPRSSVAIAYVRHATEEDPDRERLAAHDAEQRVRSGARRLGELDVSTHVILDASTEAGLRRLAQEQGARLIVFGSEYRTAPGRAEPGNTAQRLLDGGPVAIAVAAAGLRTSLGEPLRTIAISERDGAEPARRTAARLAERLGASIVSAEVGEPADLTVVGSRQGARHGHLELGGAVRAELNAARGSVLALPAGIALEL